MLLLNQYYTLNFHWRPNVHVDMCRLSQYTPALQQKTELPSRPSAYALRLIDDNSIEETPAANELHER